MAVATYGEVLAAVDAELERIAGCSADPAPWWAVEVVL
jgi:hypothetical protein